MLFKNAVQRITIEEQRNKELVEEEEPGYTTSYLEQSIERIESIHKRIILSINVHPSTRDTNRFYMTRTMLIRSNLWSNTILNF